MLVVETGRNTTPHDIHSSEKALSRHLRTKLAELKSNKSPLCDVASYTHDTNHLFNSLTVGRIA